MKNYLLQITTRMSFSFLIGISAFAPKYLLASDSSAFSDDLSSSKKNPQVKKADLIAKLLELTQEKEVLAKKNLELEDENLECKERVSSLESENEEFENMISRLKSEKENLTKQLSKLTKEKEEYKDAVARVTYQTDASMLMTLSHLKMLTKSEDENTEDEETVSALQ